MDFGHDTKVKNFLDTVLRDYWMQNSASFSPAISRATFNAAYTQYVIKSMILEAKGGGASLGYDRLAEKLDSLNSRLRSPLMNGTAFPEEILDIDDAGKLDLFKEAIGFTKSRMQEHLGRAASPDQARTGNQGPGPHP